MNDIILKDNIKILIDKIVKIIPFEFIEDEIENKETIFELYGRLAKTYLLKSHERVVESTKTSLIVASCEKNKTLLFKRLLRYDTLCKVIQPQEDVKTFKKLIEKSLKNINNIK